MSLARKMFFELPGEIKLKISCFMEEDSIRHFYTHYYFEEEKDNPVKRRDVFYINEQELYVRYEKGVLEECRLSMDVILPERRGKKEKYGIDISEKSRLSFQLYYEVEKTKIPEKEQNRMKSYIDGNLVELVLARIGVGSKEHNLKENEGKDAIVKQIELPFRVLDRIPFDLGSFSVPIQHKIADFVLNIPYSIKSS